MIIVETPITSAIVKEKILSRLERSKDGSALQKSKIDSESVISCSDSDESSDKLSHRIYPQKDHTNLTQMTQQ